MSGKPVSEIATIIIKIVMPYLFMFQKRLSLSKLYTYRNNFDVKIFVPNALPYKINTSYNNKKNL